MLHRRAVLKTAAGLPLAAVLADPMLTRAVAAELDAVSLTLPGGRSVGASLALPEADQAGSVLLIHEWWGLNDQIRAVAADYAAAGYVALAVDLMDGQVAETREEASAQMQAVDPAGATETLVGWIDWLKTHARSSGKVATVGWCFGGGWSFRASAAAPVDGTVIYYGRVPSEPEAVEPLAGPVLGHFATQDGWIDRDMVSGFEAALQAVGKPYTFYWYDADHAFANPRSGNYDRPDAQLARQRTLDFFARTIG